METRTRTYWEDAVFKQLVRQLRDEYKITLLREDVSFQWSEDGRRLWPVFFVAVGGLKCKTVVIDPPILK